MKPFPPVQLERRWYPHFRRCHEITCQLPTCTSKRYAALVHGSTTVHGSSPVLERTSSIQYLQTITN